MSAEEQPSSKRKRVDSLEDVVDPVRSDVWYDDGNIVLQAQNTQFKVYRGILARSSPVFKDMFMLPQPPTEDTQLVEGCPVVKLFDSAEEVRYILRALSGQRLKVFPHNCKMSFAEFAAFLCLGQKYDIQELYLEAKRRLFALCPATLDAYPSFPQEFDWGEIEPPEGELMQLIILGRRAGLLSILPSALYEICMMYTTDGIIDGTTTSDGSVIRLSHQDQLACLAGFRGAIYGQAETSFRWIWDPEPLSPNCATPQDCQRARRHIGGTMISASSPIIALVLLDHIPVDETYLRICQACNEAAYASHLAGRIEFWERLPVMFGLPPWTELLKERKEADIQA
ncbi:hypothetical protein HWV62_11011 [Athelia sp. TMB]|nr:hypothetical protein HWV62_11011 [Athelia sp. TMB]